MTEWIYGWMKGLAFFFIFMTAVLNCLPDQKYRKYVRFFLGMLLLILMTGPLLELFRLDERLSRTAGRNLLEAEVESMENAYQMEGLQEEYLYQGYQAEIENQIRNFSHRAGYPGKVCGGGTGTGGDEKYLLLKSGHRWTGTKCFTSRN